jgi:hypothetical protein
MFGGHQAEIGHASQRETWLIADIYLDGAISEVAAVPNSPLS